MQVTCVSVSLRLRGSPPQSRHYRKLPGPFFETDKAILIHSIRLIPHRISLHRVLSLSDRFRVSSCIVSGAFHCHSWVLFIFPSQYYSTIGLDLYLDLAVGICRLRTEQPSRATRDPHHIPPEHDNGTITLSGFAFQQDQSYPVRYDMSPHSTSLLGYPQQIRFDLFRFRSPLLTESQLFSFPPLIRMLCFGRFLFSERTMYDQIHYDVTFGDLRINVYMRLPGAFRSLLRPSSVVKPRHPLYSVGVLDHNQERTLTESEFISLSDPHTRAIAGGGLHTSQKLRVYIPTRTYPVFYRCARPCTLR
eukprot:TRINITY_DN2863_c0_g3_i1.p1 TRINITY_DN2863_c0_g3~~TRINITY_DN2863_c0_g3_i1.p1  ORF type:complete len:305 (+),score=-100.40 TRINITY_DN2863_c0_g3_i1:1446-2360(+)